MTPLGVALRGRAPKACLVVLLAAAAACTQRVQNTPSAVAVAPIDITTLVSVALLIALAAIGAAGLPAWRAARVDPSVALRRE